MDTLTEWEYNELMDALHLAKHECTRDPEVWGPDTLMWEPVWLGFITALKVGVTSCLPRANLLTVWDAMNSIADELTDTVWGDTISRILRQ